MPTHRLHPIMDSKSSKTSLSSLNTKAEQDCQWYGQLPCVFHSHQGCHQHNPAQSLIYHNPRLPQKKQKPNCIYRIFSLLWSLLCEFFCPIAALELTSEPLLVDVSCDKEPEPPSTLHTELPFDSLSAGTLAPLHPTMPYHLAFYHLDCIRRQLDPTVKVALVSELSCSGTSSFYQGGPKYTWSSDVYFDKGTFLQKQEISYAFGRESNRQKITLTGCPHSSITINRLWFKDNNGFLEAKSWLSIRPYLRDEYDWGEWWSTKEGRHARISVCRICHSDAESTLELLGHEIHVRYTCYRDLGPATDRSIPKWTSLYMGSTTAYIQRNKYEYDLYARVWRTAKKLGRPNLYVIPFPTPYGEFAVAS